MVKPRSPWRLILFALCLAAFALRAFNLAQQSLWYDEAFSLFLARMGLGEMVARTAADIQPPFYYFLLHFWTGLAGESEFAARFLSLFFGVLTIPLLYAIARRALTPERAPAPPGGTAVLRAAKRTRAPREAAPVPAPVHWSPGTITGLLAALLAVVSPLYLWYSQEARMYTLITFLLLLSSYCLLRALDHARRAWWVSFALANIAAVYTHYFAFVLIVFQFLYYLWRALPKARAGLRAALVSFAAIVVSFLPWLPFLLNRLGEDVSYWRGPLKLDEALRHIAINFTMGESVLEAIAQNIALAWLAVLLLGLLAWAIVQFGMRGRADSSRRAAASINMLVLALFYLLVPLVLLLFLFYRNPKFNARYLMLASPGLLLLLGLGLASLFALVRRGPVIARALAGAALLAAGGLLLSTSLYADWNAYFDPAFTKPDFRGAARYVKEHASADEAVVLTSGHMFPAFDYYFPNASLPELRLPDDPTLNTEHVLNFSAANELNRALAGKRGAWLVLWQDEVVDPNGVVPQLLSTRGQEAPVDAAFWHIKVRHWTLPEAFKPFSPEPEMAAVREANFKNQFKLLGWSAGQPSSADRGAAITLFWQALAETKDDYNVALRVVDAQGNFWGQLDRRPAGYNYPTTRWKPGESLFGAYTIPLLPGAPAGEYYVTATLFTAQDQTGLDVLAPGGAPIGKSVKLGPITVLPAEKQPTVLDLKVQHTLEARVGPLTLLGYTLPRDKASTGESIPLTLFWRADAAPTTDYSFQIEFGDRLSAPRPLANDAFPTSKWRAGEIVRAQFMVQVPPEASGGNVNLKLKLSDGQLVDLAQPFAIEKTDRVFVQPPAQFAQEANFNNVIALTGFDLSAPEITAGSVLTVTLNWKALGKMDKPYTVFVHLLDKDSQVKGQKDAQPLNGSRATPTWVEGEYLKDPYPVEVKADVPPGEYRVEIGWYDSADPAFARLQVLDASGAPIGNNVILNTTVRVN